MSYEYSLTTTGVGKVNYPPIPQTLSKGNRVLGFDLFGVLREKGVI